MIRRFQRWSQPPAGARVDTSNHLTTGLLAFWPNSDGAGTQVRDAGPFGYHGTFSAGTAAPAWDCTPYGRGLLFNGAAATRWNSQAVNLSIGTGAFTVTIRAQRTSPSSAYALLWSWAKQSSPGTGDGLCVYFNGTGPILELWSAAAAQFTTNLLSHSIDVSVWRHIAVTRDSGGHLTLYIDGVVVNTTTNAFNADTGMSTGQAFFGGNDSGEAFTGRESDIGLWNRCLTASQVQALYARPWAMFAPLPRYWAGVHSAFSYSAAETAMPLSDVAVGRVSATQVERDTVPLTDAAIGVVAGRQAESDALGLSETSKGQVAGRQTVSDTLALIDATRGVAATIGRATDALPLTEAARGSAGAVSHLAEMAVPVHEVTTSAARSASQAVERLSVGDAARGAAGTRGSAVDAVGLSEVAVGRAAAVQRSADVVPLSEVAFSVAVSVLRVPLVIISITLACSDVVSLNLTCSGTINNRLDASSKINLSLPCEG